MHPYGDPAGLEAVARRLAQVAREVQEEAQRLALRAGAIRWESTAADSFRAGMADRRRELDQVAGKLEWADSVLRRHGAVVESRVREIAATEGAATAWFGAQLRGFEASASGALHAVEHSLGAIGHVVGRPPWGSWPWAPHRLPEPGHKDWLEVGRFLRSQGIPL